MKAQTKFAKKGKMMVMLAAVAALSLLFSQGALAEQTTHGFLTSFEDTMKSAFSLLLLAAAAWGLYKVFTALIDLTKGAGQSKNTAGENVKDLVIGTLAVVIGVVIAIIINTGGLTNEAIKISYHEYDAQPQVEVLASDPKPEHDSRFQV